VAYISIVAFGSLKVAAHSFITTQGRLESTMQMLLFLAHTIHPLCLAKTV
jgi:hypothetical protein